MSSSEVFTKVSLSLLPTEDIRNYLLLKHDFIDLESLNVSHPELLAISTGDRETIKNALNLGGIPASQYLTVTEGSSIESKFSVSREEVMHIRDELYQLKAELGRKKLITNYNDYAGFHETFDTTDVIYEEAPIGKIIDVADTNRKVIVDEDTFKKFSVNDYIVFTYENPAREPHVARVESMSHDDLTIHFRPGAVEKPAPGTAKIFKSLGRYHRGSYAFIKESHVKMSEPRHSTLDDDTYILRKQLVSNKEGIGYTFKINDMMFDEKDSGYFCELKIKALQMGSPDPLTAYLIYEKDIDLFKGVDHADFPNICLAESKPATVSGQGVSQIMTFDFKLDDDTYPIVEKKRLCVVIMSKGVVNEDNYYEVTFLTNKVNGEFFDLQKNNTVYKYMHIRPATAPALITDENMNKADLFYNYVVRAIETDKIVPYTSGVYTKKLRVDEPIKAARARLTLRINREGMFKSETAGGIDEDRILILEDRLATEMNRYKMENVAGIGARDKDLVIIGNNIGRYMTQSRDDVQVTGGMFLKGGEPIYRMGYKIYLRSRKVTKAPLTFEDVIEAESYHELELTAVMTDRKKRNRNISDRLVFEADLNGTELEEYNDFELQIVWDTGHTVLSANDIYAEELHGAIQDLTFTLEKEF
ncbi:hypothetical protein MKY88_24375 [Lysinibacillus sp. FSL R7-0073]|uniref:hypothetical protein n=1 Tax=Lysinibacillus sp. FSL R7-0073 TaxID=2921669 RepID=UPI0030F7D71F